MEDKEENIRSVKSAAASVWMEKLPLSKEFVEEYLENRLKKLKEEENNKKLVLKRGD